MFVDLNGRIVSCTRFGFNRSEPGNGYERSVSRKQSNLKFHFLPSLEKSYVTLNACCDSMAMQTFFSWATLDYIITLMATINNILQH